MLVKFLNRPYHDKKKLKKYTDNIISTGLKKYNKLPFPQLICQNCKTKSTLTFVEFHKF